MFNFRCLDHWLATAFKIIMVMSSFNFIAKLFIDIPWFSDLRDQSLLIYWLIFKSI